MTIRVTIQTPTGPRELPEWAQCYCVVRHTPKYIHPIPFMLPDGTEIFLCPNTHHQIHTLLSLYKKYGGRPAYNEENQFSYVVQNLGKMYWTLQSENESEFVSAIWSTLYEEDYSPKRFNEAAVEALKKMEL